MCEPVFWIQTSNFFRPTGEGSIIICAIPRIRILGSTLKGNKLTWPTQEKLFLKKGERTPRRTLRTKKFKLLTVLRIQDVYPGSRILIFIHPGPWIPDPKTATKEKNKKISCPAFFCSHKYHISDPDPQHWLLGPGLSLVWKLTWRKCSESVCFLSNSSLLKRVGDWQFLHSNQAFSCFSFTISSSCFCSFNAPLPASWLVGPLAPKNAVLAWLAGNVPRKKR